MCSMAQKQSDIVPKRHGKWFLNISLLNSKSKLEPSALLWALILITVIYDLRA